MKLLLKRLFVTLSCSLLINCSVESHQSSVQSSKKDQGEDLSLVSLPRLLVRFKANVVDTASVHDQAGTKLIQRYNNISGLEAVAVLPGKSVEEVIAFYQLSPLILYVERDQSVSID